MNNRQNGTDGSSSDGLVLNRESNEPLYLQLQEAIRENITSGKWPQGHQLPAYRKLAELTQVSVITVQRAVDDLVKGNILYRRQGQGTFVAKREMRVKSNRVGMFLPNLREPFFSNLAQIIQTEMINEGYAVSIFSLDDGFAQISRAVDILLEHNVDGVMTTLSANEETFFKVLSMRETGIPVVVVDGHLPGEEISYVECDNRQGMALILEHLFELGHQRIAFASGPCYTFGLKSRLEAFQELMDERNKHHNRSYIQISHLDRDEGGWDAAHKLLSLRHPPTAIACSTDVIAAGVMRSAKSLGIKIPEDLSVVGFDDLYLAGHLEVPLTTIKQPIEKIGKIAKKLLLDPIRQPSESRFEAHVLQLKLVHRASTAPVKHRTDHH